jgi:hypothetical protein
MDRQGLHVDQLDAAVVKAFLATHVRAHGQVPTAGVMPLLGYLRREGIVAPEPPGRPAALDRLLADYREWLIVDRALARDGARLRAVGSAVSRRACLGGQPGPAARELGRAGGDGVLLG